VRTAIAGRLELSRTKLARYDRLRARLLAGRTEDEYFDQVDRVGPYLTLMRGRAFEKENIRWAERALSILEKRSAIGHDARRVGEHASPASSAGH
jgi:hypothetical protein